MANIITKLTRPVRRRLKKIAQFNKNADYRRRTQAILLLQSGHTLSSTANLLCASRTSINKWLLLFQEYGESGLVPEQKGRLAYSINEVICIRLLELVKSEPKEFGWFASLHAGVRSY